MSDLNQNGINVYFIHYSCESFYDSGGKSPRVTSIAIRNYDTAQTESFSIHHIAEEDNVFDDISKHYNDLEGKMLKRYFDFISQCKHCYFVHWNMRDSNYGFAAIEHRYRVLGGIPVQISEDRKLDLARYLIDIYGTEYTEHPRLEI